jgi:hypothetical protein
MERASAQAVACNSSENPHGVRAGIPTKRSGLVHRKRRPVISEIGLEIVSHFEFDLYRYVIFHPRSPERSLVGG